MAETNIPITINVNEKALKVWLCDVIQNETPPNPNKILKIIVDIANKEGGISISNINTISRHISAIHKILYKKNK